MKKSTSTLFATILLITISLVGCTQSDSQNNNIITVDVTATYPEKELILQDIMDVEYIPLETSEEFITMGWPHVIGKNIIIVRNRNRSSDGDIFIFDRNGKGLKKINRLGQGGEEYTFLLAITLDEENNELFINDHWVRKIFVYDLDGNFKRSFAHKTGSRYDMGVYNFDKNNLICSDMNAESFTKRNRFLVISKQDGSISREIEIPYNKLISSHAFAPDSLTFMPIRNRILIPSNKNSWMLMENSSDTIYSLSSDYSITPLIARTPSIQSINPGIFLYPAVITDRYCFMQTVKAEWDWESNTGHKRINLVYDNQENKLFECVLRNADFDSEEPMSMVSEITLGNKEIAFVHKLEAYQLLEAYEKGQLKGKLKEIAATLNEESNPVLMLIKYKK